MELPQKQIDLAKDAAAKAALALVKNDMLLGLGTGSTAEHFIFHLIERCKQGLHIRAVASSERSYKQAREGGIPMADINEIISVDMTVDGADEIDPEKRMIKGGGGALLREKIVASMSKEMVVIVDESKVVKHLGKHPLPVEIVPFAFRSIINKLSENGYNGQLRQKEGHLFVTDNGNYIFDIHFNKPIEFPEEIDNEIRSIPGVVETGLFFNLASKVFVGHKDGSVSYLNLSK